ncbi:MAG TPA: D-Ala-D-Ala carboxypeptidase family metallohydrolase [Limnobacter sp.]|nr:D-Ala-D-Ala carboxypeptidase family metallohydrolase [Limnobacter sp.]
MRQELMFHPEFCQKTLCHSDTALRCGLGNECPEALLENLQRLSNLLGSIRESLELPAGALKINSGFRSTELNAQVGGVPHSQHCLGLAADVVCPSFGSPHALALAIANLPCAFDQLILEYGRWVHVSAAPTDRPARRECLSIYSAAEGYLEGIVER